MFSQRTALVVASTHHGNTMKIAQAMAAPLQATILTTEQAARTPLAEFDLVGFGSGIYFAKHDRHLLALIKSTSALPKRTFVFSTAGSPSLHRWFHRALRKALEKQGSQVIAEFNCPGWDTFGPLAWIGGFYRGRPNAGDLENARQFAAGLLQTVTNQAVA